MPHHVPLPLSAEPASTLCLQVKLRGQRLELGEVEHALRSQPGVVEAVVMTEYTGADELPYVVGVQWHPEFHKPGVTDLLEPDVLMNDFLAEARRRG